MSSFKFFDQLQDSVLVVDDNGNVVYGNTAAAFLFDVSARRLSGGKSLNQFVSFDPDPFVLEGGIEKINEATQMREVNYTASSGKGGSVQANIVPVPSYFPNEAKRKLWIVYFRDVSLEKTLAGKYRAELDQKEVVIHELKQARAALEDYSRNLEKMVESRTSELREANVLLKTILDSLGQGILVFDKNGVCLPVHSLICRDMFGTEPAGKKVEDVLNLPGPELEMWRRTVFDEMLSFEDLAPLAPSRLPFAPPTEISLGYNLMKDASGKINGIVVVATDRTAEVSAVREAQRERDLVKRIVQVARHKEAFRLFVADADILLESMSSGVVLDLPELERQLHTLKGGAATFGLSRIADACHELEERLKDGLDLQAPAWRDEQVSKAKRIRGYLNEDLNGLSELLGPLATSKVSFIEVPSQTFESWSNRLSSLAGDRTLPEKLRNELKNFEAEFTQTATERPIGEALKHFESTAKELAVKLGKRLDHFVIEGGDVRLPLRRLQPLISTLVHAVRNSVDHGLEAPQERLSAGKPEGGTLRIRISRTDSNAKIEIVDDGRGVVVDKVRGKLLASGRADLANQNDHMVAQTILLQDLSTAEQVSDVSGRGVGLSAVADEVYKLGGLIEVHSTPGSGTTLALDFPLSEVEEATLTDLKVA